MKTLAINVVDEDDDDEDNLAFTTKLMWCGASKYKNLKRDDVLLDTASQGHLFGSSELVSNIRPAESTVRFVGVGGSLEVTLKATYEPLDIPVWFHPESPANILSYAELTDQLKQGDIAYDDAKRAFQLATPDGKELVFAKQSKMFVLSREISANATVMENEKLYPKREVDRAKDAGVLRQRLGFPSTAVITSAILGGAITGTDLTAQDFARERAIYGQSQAESKGKTRKRKPREGKIEVLPKMFGTDIHLHCDLMFIDEHVFFVSVGTPIALRRLLPDRQAQDRQHDEGAH
jgi:hypothetical protein